MSYHVRAYQAADRGRVARLFTRLWSADRSLNEKYISWRYERNPYPGSLLAVCEHDGEIIAVRGAHGMRWRAGDGTVVMPCLGDTVVDKRHEGRGLVQRMTRWLFESLSAQDIHWVVNQSPGPLVEKISLRTGWHKVGEWMVAHTSRSGGARGFEALDASARRPVERDGVRITGASIEPAVLSGLAASVTRGHVAHVRDTAYFTWRFANPLADYRWIGAYSTDGLVGYVVLGHGLQNTWQIRVLDLQGIDGHVQSLLLDQALQWGDFRQVRVWWNRFSSRVSSVLSERGFIAAQDAERRRSALLVAATRRGAGELVVNGMDLRKQASWDPRMIHSDAT